MTDFEAVVELTEYSDGPRAGLAMFRGRLHAFRSRMLDVYGADGATDLFDLVPVDAAGPDVVAQAVFRRIGAGPPAPGAWPMLEVAWSPEAPAHV